MEVFGPTLDLFATNVNRLHQDIKYYSRYPEQQAAGVNGLTIATPSTEVLYIFPPKPIRRKALNVTRNTPKALYILTCDKHITTEVAAFIQVIRSWIKKP